MPPTPKHPSQRADRGRRKPKLGEWTTPPGFGWQHGEPPEPPEGLLPASVDAWRLWMASWWAAYWTPGDVPGLRIVIRLHDLHARKPSAALATAMRGWMAAYGLTPPGRQRLRWGAPAEQEVPKPSASPYQHLRAVEDARGTT